jgi:16S rRNA (adenine1518-N6/adenine1519-N6)-dimethyltransferase
MKDSRRAREQIVRELARLGVTPERWRGQNFLLDGTVAEDAVKAAELTADSNVLEVGPGLGVLTSTLLATGARVVAVELERKFAQALTVRFRNNPKLTVISANLFDVKLGEFFSDGEFSVVANLPYSITGLALRNLLTLPPHPARLILLLQREVAERIAAPAGALSILGVMVQAHATVSVLRTVPPESFWPEPKVFSALVRIDRYPNSVEQRWGISETELMRVVRMGFSARRKQVRNTLAAGSGLEPGAVALLLASVGVKPAARAQELTLDQWVSISKEILQKSFDRNEKK